MGKDWDQQRGLSLSRINPVHPKTILATISHQSVSSMPEDRKLLAHEIITAIKDFIDSQRRCGLYSSLIMD